MNWGLRPTAARRRLIKDQERAEEYKEWIAAKTLERQQQQANETQNTNPATAVVHHPAQNPPLPPG